MELGIHAKGPVGWYSDNILDSCSGGAFSNLS
jgi:hypothetical protein